MLREQFRLIILILFTSNLLAQDQSQEILFIGHAFGSHKVVDNKIDPNLNKFLEREYDSLFNKIILGGDFIYDCSSNLEYLNFRENNQNFITILIPCIIIKKNEMGIKTATSSIYTIWQTLSY